MKRKFLINPAAGGAKSIRHLPAIEAWFRERTGEFEYVLATDREHLVRETRNALRAGCGQIVAVGGDGTVNAVANGFFEDGIAIRPEAVLALADLGTGSDYYRNLIGPKSSRGRGEWQQTVLSYDSCPVDVGRIEVSKPQTISFYYLNAANFGISGDVVRRKAAFQKRGIPCFGYAVPAFSVLRTFPAFAAVIRTADAEISGEWLGVFVSKGRFVGGGIELGRGGRLDDGTFTITLVAKRSRTAAVAQLPFAFFRGLAGLPDVVQIRTNEVHLSAKAVTPMDFDGEFLSGTQIRICLLPKALKLCFPK